ncbi:hypothetical protein W911_03645 [Hyphomicrobium nitrativorans NL23]|uniref:Uncharacterized protein n=1 Tax=Hyphomicrobium nitrativorans NL23 TaxID=1029756 RepID=V5SIK7_9HYPH|nr:hypothetical protein [Hyphomicrobium nitrativorans]AHB49900.1 hypothetical protein W911_03645 [Hyphomicrobium nitrativorans NL23]
MSLQKDGNGRLLGLLHAEARLDSADPSVQRYKWHFESIGGRRSGSNPDNEAAGIAIVGFICLGLYALGIALEFVNTHWFWFASIGGGTLAIAYLATANFFLPNYIRTAVALFLLTMTMATLWFLGYGVYSVHLGDYPTYADYLARYMPNDRPAPDLLDLARVFGTIYGVGALVVSFFPWVRMKRPFHQQLGVASALFIAAPPIGLCIYGIYDTFF